MADSRQVPVVRRCGVLCFGKDCLRFDDISQKCDETRKDGNKHWHTKKMKEVFMHSRSVHTYARRGSSADCKM
jgi:hypothetical protein